jgi:hypothetical protein
MESTEPRLSEEVFIMVKKVDGARDTLWMGKARNLSIQESRDMTHLYGPDGRVERIIPGRDVALSITGIKVPAVAQPHLNLRDFRALPTFSAESGDWLPLARALVVHPRWRWGEGMRRGDMNPLDDCLYDGPYIEADGAGEILLPEDCECLPLLNDFATGAVLVDRIRFDVGKDHEVSMVWHPEDWMWEVRIAIGGVSLGTKDSFLGVAAGNALLSVWGHLDAEEV